jgi:NAD-dependent SIR2 family protein deacetylase
MAFIHSSNVVQCPTCKNTKVTASHRDIISPLDIPTCAKCKEK